ncbi:hypothetical protein CGMCC3_g7942 [Colletotrichum fructicola]|nr:uncharacterized protein CGMCC3_g7942 [Colletotrichum fructicola]KAE9576031.1 hypothetical protein CGMCC3_g7942 [Colletotrichum fructicola]KAF4426769.1 hypothetical protein CFRS1_v002982 [Colletotrichum fructicola]
MDELGRLVARDSVLRSTSALATFSISIFLLLGLKKRGLKHPLWLWLWIFDFLGAMIFWCVWSAAFRHSHAFQLTGIIFAFSLLAYVSEGFRSTINEILSAVPFVAVSGAFMASILLSNKSALLEDGVGQVVYTTFMTLREG